jgi:DNA-binding response OmpR family regulator
MSGFDVQVALGGHAALPVVVITGQDSPESRARALRLGAKAYLGKPVDGEALLGAIAEALEGKSSARRAGCGASVGLDICGLANGSAKSSRR